MTETGSGLIVTNTNPIRSFLLSTASEPDPSLSPELRNLASTLYCQTTVPYKSLRSIWSALPIGSRPSLTRIFEGSEFVFTSPKPRERSEELKARLRKLEELAERKAYAELVKDITPKKGTDEPFSSYKDQIGFDEVCESERIRQMNPIRLVELIDEFVRQWAKCPSHFIVSLNHTEVIVREVVTHKLQNSLRLSHLYIQDLRFLRQYSHCIHVVLIMFTGYLVGYYAFRALFNHSAVMNAAGGIIGLVCGMLVETFLFIIKTSNQDKKSSASASQVKKSL